MRHHWAGPRFEPGLETRYTQHTEGGDAGQLRAAIVRLLVLFNALIFGNWLMVPDQIEAAWQWRLFVATPLMRGGAVACARLSPLGREWLFIALSAVPSALSVLLCVRSIDALAGVHLGGLVLIAMACGGAFRLKFWVAGVCNVLIFAMFIAGGLVMRAPTSTVMLPVGVLLIAAIVFNLYACYRLEFEDRVNWLMQDKERRLQQEAARANERLDTLARFDALTGCANRRHLKTCLTQLWSRARQDGQAVSLLIIDIDHFKLYNDAMGHPAGDACLVQVAHAIDAHLRKPNDIVARLGGEEFLVVLADTHLEQALQATERIRRAVLDLNLHDGLERLERLEGPQRAGARSAESAERLASL